MNAGIEDGLKVGDCAKLLLESDQYGQGTAEKLTDKKSIWTFYQLDNPKEIYNDNFISLQIIDCPKTGLVRILPSLEIKRKPSSLEKKIISITTPIENSSEREWKKTFKVQNNPSERSR